MDTRIEELIESIVTAVDADKQELVKSKLYQSIRDGTGDYIKANDYAIARGNVLAKVLKRKLSSAILPEGRMDYETARHLLNKVLKDDYVDVAEACKLVQESLNTKAGLGMKAAIPELNYDRIGGLVKRISESEDFDAIAWILDDPVINFSQSIVDDFVEKNAGLQKRSGLKPTITRTLVGGCCKWCRSLAGTYNYGEQPKEFYHRHENCRCTITYYPGDGRAQDSWTKKWR